MTRSAGTSDQPVALEPVGKGNRAAVLTLELLPEQQGFVASNAESLAEAGRMTRRSPGRSSPAGASSDF